MEIAANDGRCVTIPEDVVQQYPGLVHYSRRALVPFSSETIQRVLTPIMTNVMPKLARDDYLCASYFGFYGLYSLYEQHMQTLSTSDIIQITEVTTRIPHDLMHRFLQGEDIEQRHLQRVPAKYAFEEFVSMESPVRTARELCEVVNTDGWTVDVFESINDYDCNLLTAIAEIRGVKISSILPFVESTRFVLAGIFLTGQMKMEQTDIVKVWQSTHVGLKRAAQSAWMTDAQPRQPDTERLQAVVNFLVKLCNWLASQDLFMHFPLEVHPLFTEVVTKSSLLERIVFRSAEEKEQYARNILICGDDEAIERVHAVFGN